MRNILFSFILFCLLFTHCYSTEICDFCATKSSPAISPSGQYILELILGYDGKAYYNQFQIKTNDSKKDKILFVAEERFYTRHTLFFLWDNEDRVWVYSGDVGTFFWTRKSDNVWVKSVYNDEGNVSAPEFLKKVRPRYHKK